MSNHPQQGIAPPPQEVLHRLAVSETGFVFDPTSGTHFTVNETGLALLRLLQRNNDLELVQKTLLEEYDVNPRDLERDVLEFVGMLKKLVVD
jgi:hypothetical protein